MIHIHIHCKQCRRGSFRQTCCLLVMIFVFLNALNFVTPSLQSLYTVVDTAKYFILKKTLISHNIKTHLPNIAWVPQEHLWRSPDLWWRGSFWTWSVVNWGVRRPGLFQLKLSMLDITGIWEAWCSLSCIYAGQTTGPVILMNVRNQVLPAGR